MCGYVFTVLVYLQGKSACNCLVLFVIILMDDFVIVGQSGLGSVCQRETVFVIVLSLYISQFGFSDFIIFWVYTFVSFKFKSWFCSYTRFTDSNDYLIFLMNTLKKICEATTAYGCLGILIFFSLHFVGKEFKSQ